MKLRMGPDAGARDVPGILRNLRLNEHNAAKRIFMRTGPEYYLQPILQIRGSINLTGAPPATEPDCGAVGNAIEPELQVRKLFCQSLT